MTRARWLGAGVLATVVLGAASVWGQGAIDVYTFDSPAQEARYKALIEEFRCPKCLNTNLAGSDAPIAADLRRTVHDLVRAGRTDAEITSYLEDRYGDFVLYDPPLRVDTVLLWVLPALVLVAAIFAILRLSRRRAGAVLEVDERRRLEALLKSDARPEPPTQ